MGSNPGPPQAAQARCHQAVSSALKSQVCRTHPKGPCQLKTLRDLWGCGRGAHPAANLGTLLSLGRSRGGAVPRSLMRALAGATFSGPPMSVSCPEFGNQGPHPALTLLPSVGLCPQESAISLPCCSLLPASHSSLAASAFEQDKLPTAHLALATTSFLLFLETLPLLPGPVLSCLSLCTQPFPACLNPPIKGKKHSAHTRPKPALLLEGSIF